MTIPIQQQLPKADYHGFAHEVGEYAIKLRKEKSITDFKHLLKIRRLSRLAGITGFITSFIPNPISIYLMAQYLMGNDLVGHHIAHRGYDRLKGLPAKYLSKNYSRGKRRFLNWFTWWDVSWWGHLHNQLHHAHTQDMLDADMMDSTNFDSYPVWQRYLILLFFACTWKFTYYAPYMQKEWHYKQQGKTRTSPNQFHPKELLQFRAAHIRELWLKYYLPYIGFHWVALPSLFLPLSVSAAVSASASIIFAEIVANIQGFICIRSSHSATDLPVFTTPVQGKVDYYARQVLGTSNYHGGNDLVDFTWGWTSSQIEHHLWPDATMLQVQKMRPVTKELCKKYGLEYKQQSIWKRARMMVDIFTSNGHQPHMDTSSLQCCTEQVHAQAQSQSQAQAC